MITVRIPGEIRKYKEKLVFGLTARQLIAVMIGAAICVPLYWFGKNFISTDILSWVIIIIAVPIGGIGFIKINGLPFEKFVMVVVKTEFLYHHKRLYKTDNEYRKPIEGEKKKKVSARQAKRIEERRKQKNLENVYLAVKYGEPLKTYRKKD